MQQNKKIKIKYFLYIYNFLELNNCAFFPTSLYFYLALKILTINKRKKNTQQTKSSTPF